MDLLHFSRTSRRAGRTGFTLVEMMVGMTILLILTVIIFEVTKSTADVWKQSTGKIEGFRNARGTFEAATRMISQATLNTYFDYVDASGAFRDPANTSFVPHHYARRSDLHFVCGKSLLTTTSVQNPVGHAIFFHAPLGFDGASTAFADLEGMLNAAGLYLSYGPDPATPGFINTLVTTPRYRFRLMQFLQKSQDLATYDSSVTGGSSSWNNTDWFTRPLNADLASTARVTTSQLADNVVAFVVLPRLSTVDGAATMLAPDYDYDSRNRANTTTLHQLPPVVDVVMVVIDEASALKLGNSATPPNLGLAPLFQTAASLAADLDTLEANLGARPGNASGNKVPLRYQIFRSAVAIRGAKWSSN